MNSLEDIYAFATRESLAAPNDVFRLDIQYERHRCNEICSENEDKHHEVEEEEYETRYARRGVWLTMLEAATFI